MNRQANILMANVGMLSPMKQRPELALLVAEVISTWSNVEVFMMRLFVDLMGGPEELAATVFLALEIQSAKSAAINAAAEEKLSVENKALLSAILAVVKSHQKTRDKLAHWVWGYSDQIPDGLLLTNPKDTMRPFPADLIYVWKETDFKAAISANERLAGYGSMFRLMLSQDPRLYDALCAAPEIRERLDRQASRD